MCWTRRKVCMSCFKHVVPATALLDYGADFLLLKPAISKREAKEQQQCQRVIGLLEA